MKNKSGFEYWLLGWLDYKHAIVKNSTYMKYRNSINKHIIPKLGSFDIKILDNNIVQRFINQKLSAEKCSLSPKSVRELVNIIKNTLAYAENYGFQSKCKYELLIVRNSFKPIRVLNKNEEKALLNTLESDINIFKLGILISLLTGVRIGELCALRWEDIDFKECLITVNRTMQRVQVEGKDNKTEIIITTPKTNASIRQIPIPKMLVDYIIGFKSSNDQYILTNKNGNYIEPRVMQYKFKKYIQIAGISDANFHALRHTFATRCIEAGVDVKVLSEVLGHSNVNITLDRYVHNSIDYKKDNIERFNDYILSFSQS